MTQDWAILLLGLLVAHFLGDFTPLATARMQEAKANAGPMSQVAAHAAVHGLLVGLVVALLSVSSWGLIAAAAGIEFATHFLIDAARARAGLYVATLRDPARPAFWRVLGADQLAHQLVLVFLAVLVLRA
ncbi:MAG: DUF3307 domain-containing protein [Gemmatimonadota bacterium]